MKVALLRLDLYLKRVRRWSKQASAATFLLAICANAMAFKVDTHVWIAQRILDEVAANQKTIAIDLSKDGTDKRLIPLSPEVRDAIVNTR